jgi:hypothetical protein
MSRSRPANRQEFKEFCLRELGWPVVKINMDDDQIEDRIDYSLQYYWDYHFDGSNKVYYSYVIQDKDTPGHLSEVEIANSGVNYQNTDTVVITANSASNTGRDAVASIVTDANGSIISIPIANSGTDYRNPPSITVSSNTGSGASLVGFNGGYVPMPENIIGVVNLFPIGGALQSQNMFNIRYQIALNDLYTLSSVSMLPYYLAKYQIDFIQHILVGQQPIRYNRHENKVYLDMDWQRDAPGNMLIIEAYEKIDPDLHPDVYNDRWLLRYCSAQIKKVWAAGMKKFGRVEMPGGTYFDAQILYQEAVEDIRMLEAEMLNSYSIPAMDMIG